MLNTDALEKKITELLDQFYTRRIDKLQTLELKDTLARKNPYLFRAKGTRKAPQIIEELLLAYMSSSEEGIFGDAFFEPLAVFASGGDPAPAPGVDVKVETELVYKPIAVKSGPNVFNAQSRKRQIDEFNKLKNRMNKLQKKFDPLVGYAYGKKTQRKDSSASFRELAGQEFWSEITGDPNFYIKIIQLMKDKPLQHLPSYEEAWSKAINRFNRDFLKEFCLNDGSIDWEKLVLFNSGKSINKLIITPQSKTMLANETLQLDVQVVFYDESTKDVTNARETTYVYDNPNVAVNSSGLITIQPSLNEVIEANVNVGYGGKYKTIKVKAKPPKNNKSIKKKNN